jgi:signal transduction histidine kinase
MPVVRAGRAVATLLAAVFVVSTLAVARQGGEITSFAALSPALALIGVLPALGLLLAATVLLVDRRDRPAGLLAAMAAVAWALPVIAAWIAAAAPVRSTATAASGLLVPLVLHLAVRSLPLARRRRVATGLVVAGYAVGVLSMGTWALLTDPFQDVSCWANCSVNSFLVRPAPGLSDRLQDATRIASTVLAVGLLLLGAEEFRRSTPSARTSAIAVTLSGGATLAACTVNELSLVVNPARRPTGPLPVSTYVVSAVSLTATALVLIAAVLRRRRQLHAVEQLVARLGAAPSPIEVESALRATIGDATLRALFPTDKAAYVDAAGGVVPPPGEGGGRVVTVLRRESEPVAWLEHDAQLTDVVQRMGPALRLAVENAGIQAALLARLAELQAMRTRIVWTADAERRRLERDLHDGAQQQLLALALDLRLAAATAVAQGETRCGDLLSAAAAEAKAGGADLRELAHGLYPAALAESGLDAALATLAARAPIAVEVASDSTVRRPPQVEAAAYAMVSDAVDDAHQRSASYLAVRLVEQDGALTVETEDDGTPRTSTMLGVVDRVGALGGHVVVGASTLRAEVPCASSSPTTR